MSDTGSIDSLATAGTDYGNTEAIELETSDPSLLERALGYHKTQFKIKCAEANQLTAENHRLAEELRSAKEQISSMEQMMNEFLELNEMKPEFINQIKTMSESSEKLKPKLNSPEDNDNWMSEEMTESEELLIRQLIESKVLPHNGVQPPKQVKMPHAKDTGPKKCATNETESYDQILSSIFDTKSMIASDVRKIPICPVNLNGVSSASVPNLHTGGSKWSIFRIHRNRSDSGYSSEDILSNGLNITNELQKLKIQTNMTEEMLQTMEEEQRLFAKELKESQVRQNIDLMLYREKEESFDVNRLKESLDNYKATQLLQRRTALIDILANTVNDLESKQNRVIYKDLVQWKGVQLMNEYGVPIDERLNEIQRWCQMLAELIWENRGQISRMANLILYPGLPVTGYQFNRHREQLHQMNWKITNLLSNLMINAFIIEKQPLKQIRTNTPFAATVRLLTGNRLSVHKTPAQVKVTVISESQANSMRTNSEVGVNEAKGVIMNDTETMILETIGCTPHLSAHFSKTEIKSIERNQENSNSAEKFVLLFQSKFTVCDDIEFNVSVLSEPFVVTGRNERFPPPTPIERMNEKFNELREKRLNFLNHLEYKPRDKSTVCDEDMDLVFKTKKKLKHQLIDGLRSTKAINDSMSVMSGQMAETNEIFVDILSDFVNEMKRRFDSQDIEIKKISEDMSVMKKRSDEYENYD